MDQGLLITGTKSLKLASAERVCHWERSWGFSPTPHPPGLRRQHWPEEAQGSSLCPQRPVPAGEWGGVGSRGAGRLEGLGAGLPFTCAEKLTWCPWKPEEAQSSQTPPLLTASPSSSHAGSGRDTFLALCSPPSRRAGGRALSLPEPCASLELCRCPAGLALPSRGWPGAAVSGRHPALATQRPFHLRRTT